MDSIEIGRGAAADYDALARFHYRAGRPATNELTLVARDTVNGALAGVLVVSRPTLNAPWRAGVWPEFAGLSKRDAARRANTRLRTISRVVVEPRYRALGVARALVRRYLDAPLTPLTEAVAAMGRCCPFFARAGMREVGVAATRRDVALSRAFAGVGVEAWELVEVGRAASALAGSPALRRAVWAWGFDSRATRGLAGDWDDGVELTDLAVLGASSITARPCVYVAEEGGSHDAGES